DARGARPGGARPARGRRLRRAGGGHGRPRGRPLPAPEGGGCPVTSIGIPHSVAAALPTLSVFDITNEISRDVSSSRVERGIAYVTAAVPSSLVRVSERESGFFCDIESLLDRLVPGPTADRERILLALLGPRTEQIPF